MENLEKQCEDALFVLCDARERLPQRSADEFAKCIRLNKEINMTKVATKPTSLGTIIGEQEKVILNNYTITNHTPYEMLDNKFNIIADRFTNLKAAADQIRREKNSEFNKLMNDIHDLPVTSKPLKHKHEDHDFITYIMCPIL